MILLEFSSTMTIQAEIIIAKYAVVSFSVKFPLNLKLTCGAEHRDIVSHAVAYVTERGFVFYSFKWNL
jgi:hypothetical protein